MAKKKADEGETEEKIDVFKQIEKLLGKKAIKDGNEVRSKKRMVIPVGPALDIGLNGGIPEGTFVVIAGKPKFGKTTTIMSFAANCQKEEYGGREVYYLSVEGRFGEKNLQIEGLDMEKFHLIESTEDKIITGEEFLQAAEIFLKSDPGALVIIDSVSSLCTESETNKNISATNRNDAPKLMANFCRKMAQIITVNNSILICVTKIIANTSGFGAPTTEQGGSSLQYSQDVKLVVKSRDYVKDKSGTATGQKNTWLIENSALGCAGSEVSSIITYGIGIDKSAEIAQLALSMSIIGQSGAWCYLYPDTEREMKFNGVPKLEAYLKENPSIIKELTEEIRILMYGS